MTFKPMLAVDHDEQRLRFPYRATPKLDGLRCVVLEEKARTRSLKAFPNVYVDDWFRSHATVLDGLDGELIVGDPTASDVFNQSTSGLMRQSGRPDFTFFVFDKIDLTGTVPFVARAEEAENRIRAAGQSNVVWLPGAGVSSVDDLRRVEDAILDQGYEGVMLRGPLSRYKLGRATVNENALLKVKRFRDAEAVITGTEEQMHNANTAQRNELGRTKRSTAKAGLVGKDTLGAFVVKGAPGQPFAGVEFNVGGGLDDATRASLWRIRATLPGKAIRYKFFEVGSKDAPRHPIFLGFRDGRDI